MEGEEKYQREWKRMTWVYGVGLVERWWSGESSIQLMRGPRWEAESWAWDWPIVTGEPEWEGEMLWKGKKMFYVRGSGRIGVP